MTTVDINSYRRDSDVVQDTYRFAVHEAGIRRHGKYQSGYAVETGDVALTTPETERSIALQALLREIEKHGDLLDEITVSWTHETKDGHRVYPKVALV